MFSVHAQRSLFPGILCSFGSKSSALVSLIAVNMDKKCDITYREKYKANSKWAWTWRWREDKRLQLILHAIDIRKSLGKNKTSTVKKEIYKNHVKMLTVIHLYEGSKPELITMEGDNGLSWICKCLKCPYYSSSCLCQKVCWHTGYELFVIYVHFVVDCSPNIVIT